MDFRHLSRRMSYAAALVTTCSAPVLAGECGYEHCFGAVAVGPNGVAARASGLRTAPEAWTRAERVCRSGCDSIEVFVDGCGAIAQDARGGTWAGFAGKRQNAIAEAVATCGAEGQGNCRVRIWACSK